MDAAAPDSEQIPATPEPEPDAAAVVEHLAADLQIVDEAANDINALAFSPDDKYCVGGCGDTAVYVWDILDARLVAAMSGHQRLVTSVAWTKAPGPGQSQG